MSRGGGGDDFDENFPNEAQFWWHNARRALKGKRGKKALAELREALLMLPEKRLVSGAISTASLRVKAEKMTDDGDWRKAELTAKIVKEGIGVCAVGAYMLRKRVLELGETTEEAMRQLPSLADIESNGLYETMLEGQAAGLSRYVAWTLADRNDEVYGELTPEERYIAFLKWIDNELATAA